jgi:transcriptional regulator with XRE-family HTH domain
LTPALPLRLLLDRPFESRIRIFKHRTEIRTWEGTVGILFGEFFKEKRVATGNTLRQFCAKHGLDAGKISKIERGILTLPESGEELAHYSRCLDIVEDTDEWVEFLDTAGTDVREVREEILTSGENTAQLPLIFETLRGQKLTAEQLERLALKLEKLNHGR